jgi:hypothetical protein
VSLIAFDLIELNGEDTRAGTSSRTSGRGHLGVQSWVTTGKPQIEDSNSASPSKTDLA